MGKGKSLSDICYGFVGYICKEYLFTPALFTEDNDMKKKYAVLFAAVFAAAVFSGCSDSAPVTENSGAAVQTEANEGADV